MSEQEQKIHDLLKRYQEVRAIWAGAYAAQAVNWRKDPAVIEREIITRHAMQAASREYKQAYRQGYLSDIEARERDAKCDRQMYADLRMGG